MTQEQFGQKVGLLSVR
ncbi:MAG: hypothetical protein QXO76_03000 [Thermoproteota archaeon]